MATYEKWAKVFKSRHQYLDSIPVQFGDAKDAAFNWNGTNLQLLPLTDDTGAFHVGDGTTDFDVKVFLGTTAKYVLFDVGNVLLTLEDVDLKLGDNDELQFGDASGGDVSIKWNASNLVVIPATDDTGAVQFGNDGTKSLDVKFFGATASAYMQWDNSEDRLEFDGADLNLQDSDILQFGDAQDLTATWNGSALQVSPATDDTGAINIGDGTKDIDVKIFLSDTAHYAEFDVGNKRLSLQGTSMYVMLGTFASATSGSGVAMTAALSQALQVYVDDGNAAIASSVLTRAGRFRNLQVYTGGNREQEAVGVIGQIVSVAGTNRHNMAGVMGSYEAITSLTVDGQAPATDPWIQAAVIGRVGVGSAITTINTNGRLAGVAAMSNTASFSANSGVYTAFYAGRWGSNTDWAYGMYLENVDVGIQFAHTLTPDATRTNRAIGIGSRATEIDVTMAAALTQHLDPIQVNINVIGANPTGSSTLNSSYMLITHDTTDMSNMRLKNSDWNIVVGKDVLDVYCYQGEVDFNAAGIAVGGEAAVLGLTLDAGSNAVTGNLWNTIMVTQGTGLPATSAGLFLSHRTGTLGHSIYIEANSGATITDCIYVNPAGTITNFIQAVGLAAPFLAFSAAGTGAYSIKCVINGVVTYLHTYDSA